MKKRKLSVASEGFDFQAAVELADGPSTLSKVPMASQYLRFDEPTPGAAVVSPDTFRVTSENHEEAVTVLLVEDSTDDERLSLRALRRLDPTLEVRVARNGLDALLALGLEGGEMERAPALVLSDLKLPKVRGDELLLQVRADERLANLPFVVFSSSDEPEDVARCRRYGVSEYALKPVGFEEYVDRVRGLVRRHLPRPHTSRLAW